MNLIFDIGNSNIKLSLFQGGKEIYSTIWDNLSDANLIALNNRFTDIQHVIVSTVAQNENEIDNQLSPYFNKKLFLNENTNIPIELAYKTKSTLGKDRIAAVVGAETLFPNENKLIFDAGTALTIDFVTAKGEFLGGNISPGLNTRFKALNHFTGRLPLISVQNEIALTGDSTESAIASGVAFGMIYEIQGYIKEYQNHYGKLKVLMTGGDTNYFAEKLKNSIFVVLNLNMIGLNRILEYNA